MTPRPEISASVLSETLLVLAQMSGFALGVAKAVPGMSEMAEPLAKRAEAVANELRNHAARAILREETEGVKQ